MTDGRGNILVIVLAVLLAISISAAGYFYWQSQNNLNVNSNPIPSAEQVPVTSQDPPLKVTDAESWKTFENTTYKYSLKYPPDSLYPQTGCGGMLIENPPPAEVCHSVGISFSDIKSDAYKTMTNSIQLNVLENPDKLSLSEFVKKHLTENESSIATETLNTVKNENINNVNVISVLPTGNYVIDGYGGVGGRDLDKPKVIFAQLSDDNVLQVVYPVLLCTLRNETGDRATKGLYKPVTCYTNEYSDLLQGVVNTLNIVK